MNQRFNNPFRKTFPPLIILVLIATVVAVRFGAVSITNQEVFSAIQNWFSDPDAMTLNERIFLEIRLPRAILTLLVGASLAVGGVLMQALFRNPIVEPGLVGTSSGAAFGAALYFALGESLSLNLGEWSLPIAATLGGVVATYLVFYLSRNHSASRSSIVSLLLTGIAINALFMSGVGFLSYIARDPQARSITFWNLGTLSGASWNSLLIVGISTVVCTLLGLRYGKQLNALMLGETEAQNIGVNVKYLKVTVLLINVILVAVATAFTGVISFVGLVVPHLLRLLYGSDNRYLMLGGVLMGALLLSVADIVARMVLAPAELPIGIVTALIGVPVFIYLLRQKNYYF